MDATLPTIDSVFNPQQANDSLDHASDIATQYGKSLLESAQAQGANADQLVQTAQQNASRATDAVKIFSTDVDNARSTINDAYSNIQASRYVPNVVGRIMGLFGDHKYEEDYQKTRIDLATKNLALSQDKAESAAKIAATSINQANFARQGQITAFQSQLEMLQNQRADIATKLQLENQQKQDAATAVESLTVPQLQAALNNPSSIDGGKNPFITSGLIQDMITQKQTHETALGNALLAFKSGKIDLAQKNMQLAIENASSTDFANWTKEAEKNGYVNVPGPDGDMVRVSNTQLGMLAAKRRALAVERAKTEEPIHEAIANNNVSMQELPIRMQHLIGTPDFGDYATPEDIAKMTHTFAVAKQLNDSGDMANILAARKMLDGVEKQAKDLEDKAIAAAPKEAQSGLKRYYATGKFENAQESNGFIGAETSKSAFTDLPSTSAYANADSFLRSTFQKVISNAHQQLPSSLTNGKGNPAGSFVGLLAQMNKGVPGTDVLLGRTLTMPNPNNPSETIKQTLQKSVTQSFQVQALGQIVRYYSTRFSDRPALTAFQRAFHNGDFTDDVKTNGQLDVNKLFSVIGADDPRNLDFIISKLRDPTFQRQFYNWETGQNHTALEAAYRQLLFNNDPTITMRPIAEAAMQAQAEMAAKFVAAKKATEQTVASKAFREMERHNQFRAATENNGFGPFQNNLAQEENKPANPALLPDASRFKSTSNAIRSFMRGGLGLQQDQGRE